MLKIRLSRTGKHKAPQYRIVVQQGHKDPWADAVEIIGHYNPRTNPSQITLKEDRAKHWLSKGAQPSDTVHNLFVAEGILEGEKRGTVSITNKRKAKIEEKNAAAKEKEEAKKAEEVAASEKTSTEETPEPAPTEPETPKEETPAEEPKPEENA